MSPTTVQDAATKTIQVFEGVCKSLKLNHTIEVDPDNPANDEEALLFINGGEQYIFIDEQDIEHGTLTGNDKVRRICYTIQHEVTIHGVYYYSDGSGEPPSTDVVDDSTCQTVWNAVETAISLHFQNELHKIIETEAICESEKEADESWEAYCMDLENDPANPCRWG